MSMLVERKGLLGKVESFLTDWRAGRHEPAIATLMAAIDATAKKRYPGMRVGERFQKFLAEEVGRALGGKYITARNDLTYEKNGKERSVGDQFGAIYHLCRCYVLHEESYSDKIEFEITGDLSTVRICHENGKIILNDGFVNAMFHAVIYAEENKDIFTKEIRRRRLAPIGQGRPEKGAGGDHPSHEGP